MEKEIDIFKNNILCRRDSNQIKAKNAWNELKSSLSKSDVTEFEVEWNHYMISEHTTDEFSKFLKNILLKFGSSK